MATPTTALYAAAGALLLIVLAFNVTRHRRRLLVGVGSGGDAALAVAIRAHANAVEYLPIALLLLLLLELNAAPAALLHVFGAVLLAARGAHAAGLLRHGGGRSRGRLHGTLWTWLVIVAMAGTLAAFAIA